MSIDISKDKVGTLTFVAYNGNQEVVAENVRRQNVTQKVLADLKRRAPNYVSYYQRVNQRFVDDLEQWEIDFGSWSEFYIWTETKPKPEEKKEGKQNGKEKNVGTAEERV